MKERNSPIQKGESADDFTLKDQDGKEFKLSDFKGKKVLLSFHPGAWTGVCAEQMKSLEDNAAAFASLNTIAVGISIDTIPSKKAWAESLGIKETRLLSDSWPHGAVSKLYGLFQENNGLSQRANVVIDENGKVIFVKVYPTSQLPDIQEVIQALK